MVAPCRSRLRALALLALTAALTASCGGEPWATKDIGGLLPQLRFTLVDERGETVTAERYAGRVKLLFFGFSHCPDVCPITLARISRVLDNLPADAREATRVLFVSVDPNRDTPERLADYTDKFGPQFVGLTGSEEQLRALTRRYRATYGYGEGYPDGDYSVSHSSGVWVFDREGDARLLVRNRDSDEALAGDLRRLLEVASEA